MQNLLRPFRGAPVHFCSGVLRTPFVFPSIGTARRSRKCGATKPGGHRPPLQNAECFGARWQNEQRRAATPLWAGDFTSLQCWCDETIVPQPALRKKHRFHTRQDVTCNLCARSLSCSSGIAIQQTWKPVPSKTCEKSLFSVGRIVRYRGVL